VRQLDADESDLMTQLRSLLEMTAGHAAEFLEGLETAPVAATATLPELRRALARPLPQTGLSAEQVIEELVHDVDGGILGSAGGRFFGWVIGGAVPAALAADWLTATWDQNAALYACGPAEAVIEEITGAWLKELLGLPAEASFAFTTGAQMAHVTALAAARSRIFAERGWDVERRGLAGAPTPRVICGGRQHASIDRAVRLLGLGTDALRSVGTDPEGRLDLDALEHGLVADPAVPTIVCLQAGEINIGAFDPFAEACRLAHEHGAWVHVDGAFGLWAATSPRYAQLIAGVEQADSWTTDGHKWLNVPFDCGFAFVRDPAAHRAAMTTQANYLITAIGATDPAGAARDQIDWNPEWSRRGRAVTVYAAIRALGRQGIREMIERCSDQAHHLVTELGALPGAELLAEPHLNQGLVRFLARDGDHDRRTDDVIARIQATGETWFGGTTWNGQRAMRVSVINWQTSGRDIDRAIDAVRDVLTQSSPDAT
jgi:glutamate/tyrosine decarboxylase-like PLP-dependent enzyme